MPARRPALEWHTVGDVASRFNVSESTVRRWIRHGDLRSVKVGGTLRVPRSELERCSMPEQAA